MTDPIRIPVVAPREDAHGCRYTVIDGYATITPDLARQIVELSGVSGRLAEQAHKPVDAGPAPWRLCAKCGKEVHRMGSMAFGEGDEVLHVGCAEDTPPAGDAAPCGGCRCYKTDLGWTHSSKSYDSCCVNRGEPEPTTPPADDAAVEALMEVRYCNDSPGAPPVYAIHRNTDCARSIIKAIRAGKVPMIVHEDNLSPNELLERDLTNDNNALRAQLAEATERAEEAEREVSDIEHAIPDDDDMRSNAECVARIVAQRDEARAEVERLKGRKVTLPAKTSPDTQFSPKDQTLWNGAIDACAHAIRAAGVEVA